LAFIRDDDTGLWRRRGDDHPLASGRRGWWLKRYPQDRTYGESWLSRMTIRAGAEQPVDGGTTVERDHPPAYSGDRGQQFQAIVGTNSTASWAGFMPIG
jgi:hypothetical protein